MIEALTFDVTGTLLHSPRLGSLYSETLGRHGIEVAPREAELLVRQVWQEMSCRAEPGHDRFASHPGGPRGWWRRFLDRLCEHLGSPPPSAFAAAELYHRFGTPEAWEIFPEVRGVLEELHWMGLRLGVVSNWDPRLPALLERLDLARYFTVVVHSSGAGMEKPDPRIFAQALSGLDAAPERALHIGDGKLEDFEGAIGAGMHALLVDRRRGGGDLRDLTRLPARLAEGRVGSLC